MDRMNSDKIGQNAVTCIEHALRNCTLLRSEIEKRGNSMSWDGQVVVFHTSQHDKDHFYGNVPVQVKGTYKVFTRAEEVHELASVKDLEVYQRENGVIYFYVYMNELESLIYYSMLLPYDLKRILKTCEHKNKVNIPLHRFPEGNISEMTNIFMDFVSNKKKQAEVVFDELYTLEELESKGVAIESLGFSITGIGIDINNIEEYISTHSIYLYAQTKGIKRYIPIGKAIDIATVRDVNAPVEIDGVTYYSTYLVRAYHGVRTIQFGRSFSLEMPQNQPATLNMHVAGKLSERISDIEFILAFSKSKKVSFNGSELSFDKANISDDECMRLEKTLSRLKLIKQTLDELNVQEDLEIDKISENDERKINTLIRAILNKEPISLNPRNEGDIVMGFYDIANLSILIFGHKSKDTEGNYSINSFTKPYQLKIAYEEEDKKLDVIGSQYLLLISEHYIRAANLNYDTVFSSLTSFGTDDVLIDRIVMNMLEALKAYDLVGKDDLLKLAEKLCGWVIASRDTDNRISDIDLLNKVQIKKRSRDLTAQETVDLLLVKNQSKESDILCAANILLGETEEAKKHFFSLPEESVSEIV